jgi:hypothetical protein
LKFSSGDVDGEMVNLYKKIKPLVSLRNELTHNQNLYPRLPAFIGRKTPNVNDKDIIYCDIVLWNMEGELFDRADGTLGFFSQHRNAMAELHSYFVDACLLIDRVVNLSLDYAESFAKKLGFTEYAVLESAQSADPLFITL